jgi:hypothetical protein
VLGLGSGWGTILPGARAHLLNWARVEWHRQKKQLETHITAGPHEVVNISRESAGDEKPTISTGLLIL